MLQDPRSLLQQAEERRKNGRPKDAIAICLEGLSRHPNLDALRVALGRAYLESGQPAEARDALQEVFARQPDHHLAGKHLAEARKRLGDLPGAAATCREILRHYPRDREVEALLASVEPLPAGAAGTEALADTQPGSPAGSSDPSPDYLPEDVAPVDPAAGRGASGARAPEAPSPGDALQTNTLAELYLKQGLVDRALEVYRGMLRLDPRNEPLRRRVEELEQRGSEPATTHAPAATPGRTPAAPASIPSPAARAAGPVVPRDVRQETEPDVIARLERWLHAIRSGPADAGRPGVSR